MNGENEMQFTPKKDVRKHMLSVWTYFAEFKDFSKHFNAPFVFNLLWFFSSIKNQQLMIYILPHFFFHFPDKPKCIMKSNIRHSDFRLWNCTIGIQHFADTSKSSVLRKTNDSMRFPQMESLHNINLNEICICFSKPIILNIET